MSVSHSEANFGNKLVGLQLVVCDENFFDPCFTLQVTTRGMGIESL